jgi:hypothetical protein
MELGVLAARLFLNEVYGVFSVTCFPSYFTKMDRQDLKIDYMDASRCQLQSVLKIRV